MELGWISRFSCGKTIDFPQKTLSMTHGQDVRSWESRIKWRWRCWNNRTKYTRNVRQWLGHLSSFLVLGLTKTQHPLLMENYLDFRHIERPNEAATSFWEETQSARCCRCFVGFWPIFWLPNFGHHQLSALEQACPLMSRCKTIWWAEDQQISTRKHRELANHRQHYIIEMIWYW